MNPLLLIFCTALAVLQVVVPRRWAFLPLLIAACHSPYIPFWGGMTVCRVVLLVGLIRAGSNGWLTWSVRNRLDLMVGVFAAIALLSTMGHTWDPYNPLIVRLRLVLDVVGTYLYMRAYLANRDSLELFSRGLAMVLIPFACLLLVERISGINPYAAIGARSSATLVRDGKIRAKGPFGTPILTGTCAAVSIPLLIPLWRTQRRLAIAGLGASLVVVFATVSSGPIGTTIIGLTAVALWKWRQHLKPILIAICACLFIMQCIKTRPIWYLMALTDLVGGSTGWHRAYLIDMAAQHLGEWWVCGSDYTRHWMPYGLVAVPEHCDLTNYYIHLGVLGGLPLMCVLLIILWKSFRLIGQGMSERAYSESHGEFWLWCVGSTLFAHAITFLSISYYDQIYVFFWGLIGGLAGFVTPEANEVAGVMEDGPAHESGEDAEVDPCWGRGQARRAVGNILQDTP